MAAIWSRAYSAASRRLRPGNMYGVVGFGIGRRRVGRSLTKQRALVVYVQTKQAKPRHPVPKITLRDGDRRRTLPVDVRATSVAPRSMFGTNIRPHGLGCGAPILVPTGTVRMVGGVACVLGDAAGPTHIVTAGHLFFPARIGTRVYAGLPGRSWRVIGQLARNLLDEPKELDAAFIELTPAGRDIARQTHDLMLDGKLKLPAPAGARDVQPNESVFGFPSTRGEWTSPTEVEPLDSSMFHLFAPRRGMFTIHSGLRTLHAITGSGDSGSGLLVEQAGETLLVGLCSGGDGSGSCFTSATQVVSELLATTASGTFMWGSQ